MLAAIVVSLLGAALAAQVAVAGTASKTFRPMQNLADADVPPCSPGFHVDVFIPAHAQEPITHEFVDGGGQPIGAPCPNANVTVTKYEPGQQPPGATNPEWQTHKSYRVTITSSSSSKPQPKDFGVKVTWQTTDDAGGGGGQPGGAGPPEAGGEGTGPAHVGDEGADPDDVGGGSQQGGPKLVVEKAADAGSVPPGGLIGFTVTVRNVGDAVAPDVKLQDELGIHSFTHSAIGGGLSRFNRGSPASGASVVGELPGECAESARVLPRVATHNHLFGCSIGQLAPGESYSVSFTVRVPTAADVPQILQTNETVYVGAGVGGLGLPLVHRVVNRAQASGGAHDKAEALLSPIPKTPARQVTPEEGGNTARGTQRPETVHSQGSGEPSPHKATYTIGEGGSDAGVGSEKPDAQVGDSIIQDGEQIERVIEDLQKIVVRARRPAGGTTGTRRGRALKPLGRAGKDLLFGGAGADLQYGGGGADALRGGPGNDLVFGGSGNDRIDGGDGNDELHGDGSESPAVKEIRRWAKKAGLKLRRLRGKRAPQRRAGNDRIDGGAGNDRIDGGAGNDRLTGGDGRDSLTGGKGKDRIDARDGKRGDKVVCGPGRDTVLADKGDKVVTKGRNRCETVRRTKKRR